MATLKRRSTGPEVKKLQKRLKKAGFDPGTIDGHFGGGTEAAVMAFQASKGLLAEDLRSARRAVNGGSHGLAQFTEAYRIGQRVIPDIG